MSLTPKQQRFVDEYLIDLNAAGAARRAGYSERTADRQGHENLRKPEIAAAIAAAQQTRAARVGLTSDDVLRELAILGQSSVWNYAIDDYGQVTLTSSVPPEAIRAVASIKRKIKHQGAGRVEYETEIKLWDKNSALEKAGKHLGLFVERVRHEGAVAVIEDAGWYSNNAHDLAAAGAAASGAGAPQPGAVQGGGVREKVGQDGPRPAGDDPRPRPRKGRAQGGD